MAVTVTAAYAKAHLPELLKTVRQGKSVTITHYNKPVADLVPSKQARKPTRKFGTLKGKIRIIDPDWAAPMNGDDLDAFIAGRY